MVPWHCATGQWFAQLLFTGKTSKGLVQRERVMSDTTPNHWQSCESLVRWLAHVDGIVNKGIDASTPWLVILDCAIGTLRDRVPRSNQDSFASPCSLLCGSWHDQCRAAAGQRSDATIEVVHVGSSRKAFCC
eukprot:2625569-Amphidinium_carterae.2